MKYVQHEKLKTVKAESQAAGEFFEWAIEEGFISTGPSWRGLEAALATWQEIDLRELEREKLHMLAELRAARECASEDQQGL